MQNNNHNYYDLLTVSEIADLLRLSRVSIYRMIDSKKLPCYKLSGSLRFDRSDILEFIKNNKI